MQYSMRGIGRYVFASAALIAAESATAGVAFETGYRETFPFSASLGGSESATLEGWRAVHDGARGVAAGDSLPQFLSVWPIGVTEMPAVNSDPQGPGAGGAGVVTAEAERILIFTEEVAGTSAGEARVVSFQFNLQQGEDAPTEVRLAAFVNGAWRASETAFTAPGGEWATAQFTLGTERFDRLDVDFHENQVPADRLVEISERVRGESWPGGGTIHAIGVYVESNVGNGAVAIDNFQIECEPGGTSVESEDNDTLEDEDCFTVFQEGQHFIGKLDVDTLDGCQPDTFLLLFDKLGNIINRDDNSSQDAEGGVKGNGWASGLRGIDTAMAGPTAGFVSNDDGSYSLRIGVTGRPDGFDNNFDGFFQNAPHGQLGSFEMTVRFTDDSGELLGDRVVFHDGSEMDNPAVYADEFVIGAEAFHINYLVPVGYYDGESIVSVDITDVRADICIDNTIDDTTIANDVDHFRLKGLVPLCDYCLTQVGGVDYECNPTDTLLGWFDKSGELIQISYTWRLSTGYDELCFTADVNGEGRFAVTGDGDENFDGLADSGVGRAPVECPGDPVGHGIRGCWTLQIRGIAPHGEGSPLGPDDGTGDDPLTGGDPALINALEHGDLNMDGRTDASDLSLMLGHWGLVYEIPTGDGG